MACCQLYRLPVWAAVFGGNIAALEPPAWATDITVFADNDPICERGYRPGLRFAGDAREKWRRLPRVKTVRVLQPLKEGTDFADLLIEKAAA
jgi:hypothetical protein